MPTVTIQHTDIDYKAAHCSFTDGVFVVPAFPSGAGISTMDIQTIYINVDQKRVSEGFIWFDILNNIPKNCFIKNAKIKLFPASYTSIKLDGIHKVAVYELAESFPNNYIGTPEAYPSYDPTIIDEAEIPQGSWMEFIVTSSVQKIVNSELENFGWTLKPNPKTFPEGTNFDYSFVVANSGESEFRKKEFFPKIEITYVDALVTPINLDPDNNIKLRKDQPITLNWSFNGYDISDNQKSFDLQYKINNNDWTTISQTTSNPYYIFDANTFNASNITWRVRTTDNSDTTSMYSEEASFVVVDPPTTPNITNNMTITTAKPTISWTSTNQKGYEIVLKDTDNDIIWQDKNDNSTATNKAIDVILANTKTYKIELKILDNNGFWSNTTTKNITISVTSPQKPIMTLKSINNKVGKTTFIINATDLEFYEIYRKSEDDNSYIKIATNQTELNFSDYTQASGAKYSYFVRAYNSNFGYADSDPITAILVLDCSKINLVTNPEKYVCLEVRNAIQNNNNVDVEYNQYAGRKYNTPEFGEFEEETLSLEFETFNKNEFENLQILIDQKETLLYRDEQNRKMYGTINGLQIDEDKNMDYWIYSFEFKKSDYNEKR